jgi:hypothetical protein
MNKNELKEVFEDHLKEDMLKMHKDAVPNVRLTLAKAIRSHFKQIGGQFLYDKEVNKVVRKLLEDSDKDVKFVVKDIMTYQQSDTSETSSQNSRLSVDEDNQSTGLTINSTMESLLQEIIPEPVQKNEEVPEIH